MEAKLGNKIIKENLMQKIAIIGAYGFIGHHLLNYFLDKYNIVAPTKKELDITVKEDWARFLKKENPEFVILLAGSKNVKELEKDWEYAYKINTQSVINYIQSVEENGIKSKLIYFSSDYVFDGSIGNYTSDDLPSPITNYGKSKLLSEQALQASRINYKIIRTSAVMGEGGVFYEWLIKLLKTEKYIDMYSNVFFTPTDINLLIRNIEKIINNYDCINKNILHVVGEESLSRYNFACHIKKTMQNAVAEIKKIQIDTSHSTFEKNLTMLCDNIDKHIEKDKIGKSYV